MSDFRMFCIAYVVCRGLDGLAELFAGKLAHDQLPGFIASVTVSAIVVWLFGGRASAKPTHQPDLGRG